MSHAGTTELSDIAVQTPAVEPIDVRSDGHLHVIYVPPQTELPSSCWPSYLLMPYDGLNMTSTQ